MPGKLVSVTGTIKRYLPMKKKKKKRNMKSAFIIEARLGTNEVKGEVLRDTFDCYEYRYSRNS